MDTRRIQTVGSYSIHIRDGGGRRPSLPSLEAQLRTNPLS